MSQTLRMRKAAKADLPAIVALLADDPLGRSRESAALPLDDAYVAGLRAIESDPNQLLVAAERDGNVVGTLQLTFVPGISHRGAWRGQIEAVRVASTVRGEAIGSLMVEWAVERCRERGCRLVQLTTDSRRPEAHRFYERLGFAATHVGMKRALEPDRERAE